jgi:hypothetical protein
MNDVHTGRALIRWWAILVVGAAAALLIAWLSRISGVPMRTVLSIAAAALALGWLVVLVALPWNLYFAARRVVAEIVVSRERGIAVPEAQDSEARRIARRMLWFALAGHVGTATVAGVITYYSGSSVGYYFIGAYLLSATIRPAAAYFGHLRERIRVLSRESRHPREDIVALRQKVDWLEDAVKELRRELPHAARGLADDIRRTESELGSGIAHVRQLLSADLASARDAQAADRDAAAAQAADSARRIDRIARRVEDTLDGISDHAELQAGLRALVRMIRTESAAAPPT